MKRFILGITILVLILFSLFLFKTTVSAAVFGTPGCNYQTVCPGGPAYLDPCTGACLPYPPSGCTSDYECPGCQACDIPNGTCYDSNAWCPAGQYCSDAVCYSSGGPPPPPPGCNGLQCANGCFDTSGCTPPNSPACGDDGTAYCYPPAPPPPPPPP